MGVSSLQTQARQGGRGKKRVQEKSIPSFNDAQRGVYEAAKKYAKAPTTLKKYSIYWKQFVAWVRQVAAAEAKKAEEFRSRQAKAASDPTSSLGPENDIEEDDDLEESADTDAEADVPEAEGSESGMPTGPKEETEKPPTADFESNVMDARFPTCFEGWPTECTAIAMTMFLWDKCYLGKLTYSTAGQVIASLIAHYDALETPFGYIFKGEWRYDECSKTFRGNPGRSDRVKGMLNAVHKREDQPDRKHSRAMSFEDMDAIHQHIQANHPSPHLVDSASLAKRGRYLYYSALSSLGFVVWTRNSEACMLKYKHLDFHAPKKRCSNGQTYERVVVNIRYRKNWQRKLDSEELGLEGHVYNIYRQPTKPAIDLFHHLVQWKEFYEHHLLRRPLQDDDFIFPTVNFANLTAHPDTEVKRQAVDKLIKEMAGAAGLHKPESYTTHCFRRGGAQYRFMFASIGERWTLARIRWWGGWAANETGDTLMKYLLDELHSYEDDHADALCPFDETASHSHNGEDRLLRPFTAADGAALTERCDELISSQFSRLADTLSNNIVSYLKLGAERSFPGANHALPEQGRSVAAPTQCHSPLRTREHAQPFAPPHYFNTPMPYYGVNAGPFSSMPSTTVDAPWQVPSASTSRHGPESQPSHATRYSVRFQPIQRRPTPDVPGTNTHEPYSGPRHCVPTVSRTAAANALDIIIADWETPQPHRCPVPLKDWRPEWYKENRQGQAYHIRKVIATEFITQFSRDRTKFNKAYPEHVRGMTPLFKAITVARQARNEVKTRAKKTVPAGGAMDVDVEAGSEGGSSSPEAY
ncbi:hypothetical protein D9611_001776 [Ephemerocybe angulata]|uniref:Tyr recombinase domain-containing protein n=1 Tax=Ephemerocybe angulata TaxID=980116 RepID=A0A8H5FM99_9AGAR|nr:hypothetical protein D9611_001776 [Tulosesus angulatus]